MSDEVCRPYDREHPTRELDESDPRREPRYVLNRGQEREHREPARNAAEGKHEEAHPNDQPKRQGMLASRDEAEEHAAPSGERCESIQPEPEQASRRREGRCAHGCTECDCVCGCTVWDCVCACTRSLGREG